MASFILSAASLQHQVIKKSLAPRMGRLFNAYAPAYAIGKMGVMLWPRAIQIGIFFSEDSRHHRPHFNLQHF